MSDTPPRGFDEILEADFVAELHTMQAPELRRRRADARELEDELSYKRRLLHGKLDILKHELERRQAEHSTNHQGELLQRLSELLSRGGGGGSRGGRSRVTPRATSAPRRPSDDDDGAFGVQLTRLKEMSAEEIEGAIETLVAEERRLSDRRRAVHTVIDTLTSALQAGYREGRLSADDLLKG